jgi:hypothetical protein
LVFFIKKLLLFRFLFWKRKSRKSSKNIWNVILYTYNIITIINLKINLDDKFSWKQNGNGKVAHN